jgi:hypothetical protein
MSSQTDAAQRVVRSVASFRDVLLAGVLLFALWLITDYRAADREVDAVVAPHPEVARSSAR